MALGLWLPLFSPGPGGEETRRLHLHGHGQPQVPHPSLHCAGFKRVAEEKDGSFDLFISSRLETPSGAVGQRLAGAMTNGHVHSACSPLWRPEVWCGQGCSPSGCSGGSTLYLPASRGSRAFPDSWPLCLLQGQPLSTASLSLCFCPGIRLLGSSHPGSSSL